MKLPIIWSLLLTVCSSDNTCIQQDVALFKTKNECHEAMWEYQTMPTDGHWQTIMYRCVVAGGREV